MRRKRRAACVAPLLVAVTAGFFDRIVPTFDLDTAANHTAEMLSKINMAAHVATKLRARGSSIKAIRTAIDTEMTLTDAEQKVASRNAPA